MAPQEWSWHRAVEAARRDPARVEAIFRYLGPALIKYAGAFLPAHAIDDGLQEARIRIWQALDHVDLTRSGVAIGAFLNTAGHYGILTAAKEIRRRSGEKDTEPGVAENQTPTPGPAGLPGIRGLLLLIHLGLRETRDLDLTLAKLARLFDMPRAAMKTWFAEECSRYRIYARITEDGPPLRDRDLVAEAAFHAEDP